MATSIGRRKVFQSIDKNGNGVIDFKEWYKHFDSLVRSGKKTEKELLDLYRKYDEEGSSKGIDFDEFNKFMDEVFGHADDFELRSFVEKKIKYYADMIIKYDGKADELAMGELTFYMAVQRAMTNKATTQDVGMLDAINDFLQEKGIVDKKTTFYH